MKGGSQTGSSLEVDGGDASTDGLLKAGDMVEVGGRIHMLTADLNTNSSGEGMLQFIPRLRTAPSDNDPVLLYRPSSSFLMANNANARLYIGFDRNGLALDGAEAKQSGS